VHQERQLPERPSSHSEPDQHVPEGVRRPEVRLPLRKLLRLRDRPGEMRRRRPDG
jgi:hypothetical protein